MNISKLKGIGEQTAQRFAKLGIQTTDDLLLFYPRGYETFEEPILVNDVNHLGIVAIYAMVVNIPKVNYRSRVNTITVQVVDETGSPFRVRWFHSTFILNALKQNGRYVFRGRVHFMGDVLVMDQPKIFSYDDYVNTVRFEPMKPIYRLTDGLHQSNFMKAVMQCFEQDLIPDEYLPGDIIDKYHFMNRRQAFYAVHFPQNQEELTAARKRLVFDEFFLFTLGIRKEKNGNNFPNFAKIQQSAYSKQVIEHLSFELTNAQKKVYSEILRDFAGDTAANRLVQGDVGSGKTILAILAMLDMAEAGFQSVLMAPTEVLATQHYEKIKELIEKNALPIEVALLTGSVKESAKKDIREGLISGRIQLLVGTHAVITQKVEYCNLGLVITDEQHRFGVRQRDALYNKGNNPHVIVMSATPIPRSLAVILYGDLEISIVDEKPAMRLPIKNCVVNSSYHPNAYRFITNEVAKGHQVYVLCAMAEPSDEEEEENQDGLNLLNVVDYSEELKNVLPNSIRIAYLHGKMKPAQKNQIMEDFAAHQIDVLVSTTVIEVGIDVPNATVMMVENAERFGLSTLHQLRGRVGRGKDQSYCIFVSDTKSEHTLERLNILKESNDGFYVSEKDLELRGPGDILGTRQSGDLGFSLGDIYADAKVLMIAANEAKELLSADPQLKDESHLLLSKNLEEYMQNRLQRLSI